MWVIAYHHLHAQVHDQRSATTEEEEGATDMWLDGVASSSQEESGLASQARHMIQGQRQYYDEVHVIKEQVLKCQPTTQPQKS